MIKSLRFLAFFGITIPCLLGLHALEAHADNDAITAESCARNMKIADYAVVGFYNGKEPYVQDNGKPYPESVTKQAIREIEELEKECGRFGIKSKNKANIKEKLKAKSTVKKGKADREDFDTSDAS